MAKSEQVAVVKVEGINVLTPAEVPEWVNCFITKRQIRGADARFVEFQKGKEVWVHKRFLGETQSPIDDDDYDDDLGYELDEPEDTEDADAR